MTPARADPSEADYDDGGPKERRRQSATFSASVSGAVVLELQHRQPGKPGNRTVVGYERRAACRQRRSDLQRIGCLQRMSRAEVGGSSQLRPIDIHELEASASPQELPPERNTIPGIAGIDHDFCNAASGTDTAGLSVAGTLSPPMTYRFH